MLKNSIFVQVYTLEQTIFHFQIFWGIWISSKKFNNIDSSLGNRWWCFVLKSFDYLETFDQIATCVEHLRNIIPRSLSQSWLFVLSSGQSYKHFMIVNYDSRVVIWGNFKSGTTLES